MAEIIIIGKIRRGGNGASVRSVSRALKKNAGGKKRTVRIVAIATTEVDIFPFRTKQFSLFRSPSRKINLKRTLSTHRY